MTEKLLKLNQSKWNSYLISSSGLKQLISGSQADTSRLQVKYSFRGFLLSSDLRVFEVFNVTASCFNTEAVWWQISSACCVATCLWMLIRSLKSCWQHFHHFSLHSRVCAGTSLVLTKRANACNYISNMPLLTLSLKLAEVSVNPLYYPSTGDSSFMLYFSIEELSESNSFLCKLYTSV